MKITRNTNSPPPLPLSVPSIGLEMDEEDSSYTDGTFQSHRYFTCGLNRALFVPISICKLDSRFQDVVDSPALVDIKVGVGRN